MVKASSEQILKITFLGDFVLVSSLNELNVWERNSENNLEHKESIKDLKVSTHFQFEKSIIYGETNGNLQIFKICEDNEMELEP